MHLPLSSMTGKPPSSGGGILNYEMEKATFAGGCFWGVEHLFNEIPGVVEAASGYAGGSRGNPTHEQGGSGRTRDPQAGGGTYHPSQVTYPEPGNAFLA